MVQVADGRGGVFPHIEVLQRFAEADFAEQSEHAIEHAAFVGAINSDATETVDVGAVAPQRVQLEAFGISRIHPRAKYLLNPGIGAKHNGRSVRRHLCDDVQRAPQNRAHAAHQLGLRGFQNGRVGEHDDRIRQRRLVAALQRGIGDGRVAQPAIIAGFGPPGQGGGHEQGKEQAELGEGRFHGGDFQVRERPDSIFPSAKRTTTNPASCRRFLWDTESTERVNPSSRRIAL